MTQNKFISTHLDTVLKSYSMNHIAEKIKFCKEKQDVVRKALEKKFGNALCSPIFYSGSFSKGTAINEKFDIDLIVPFRHESNTIPEIYEKVFGFLNSEFSDVDKSYVRRQTWSVGIHYNHYRHGEISIDVVPAREIGPGQYLKDRYLNIWNSQQKTHKQTNLSLQVEAISQSADSTRNLIRLLKVWKLKAGRSEIKSFLLELLAIEAMKNKPSGSTGLWEDLSHTLAFIRDRIETIQLRDPGNSNNIVTDILTQWEKTAFRNEMATVLRHIQSNAEFVKIYFPENTHFQFNMP